jgi:carotenoid cleavage dioxygenase-like enzyme
MTEFVQLDRRLVGRENRFGYGVWLAESDGEWPGRFQGILKWDRELNTSTVHALPEHLETGEPCFVPAQEGSGEDDGYLMTYVYDWARDRSDLFILDASNVADGPIARIQLPFRIPFGFHGIWVPA